MHLKTPPSAKDLEAIIAKLGIEPRALLRTKEAEHARGSRRSEKTCAHIITAMVEHPILIERPIAMHAERAVIDRPPEKVLQSYNGARRSPDAGTGIGACRVAQPASATWPK